MVPVSGIVWRGRIFCRAYATIEVETEAIVLQEAVAARASLQPPFAIQPSDKVTKSHLSPHTRLLIQHRGPGGSNIDRHQAAIVAAFHAPEVSRR